VAPPEIFLSPVETLRFWLHNVGPRANLQGQWITLPSESAHGYHWALKIYFTATEHFAVFLVLNDPDVTVEAEFVVKVASQSSKTQRYTFFSKLETSMASHIFRRQDGSLMIEVDIRVYQNKKPVWYPTLDDNLAKSLMENFMSFSSHFTTDVTFTVGGEAFCLHGHVLADRAPALFELIKEPTGQTIPLPIDVDAGTFRSIYRYIYTGNWSPSSSDGTVDADVDAGVAKTTLTLADFFGCTGLKLMVESVMVDKVLKASNAAEMLLLGDSLHCALLKEAAIKEIFEYKDAARDSAGWALLKESNTLLEELMNKSMGMRSDETAATAVLTVGELRDQLLEHGAAVDGSREMLVQRLLAITATDAAADVA
jgi:BTB/POZ domain